MLPLNFNRGTPITADHLNSLVNEIRINSLTAGLGYTLNRTPSGTSLSINQQATNGGGSGGASGECPFLVTDVSEAPEGGGQAVLKLNVKCEEIQAFSSGDFHCWPDTTSPEEPNFVIEDIPQAEEAWYGIYLQIIVDQRQNLLVDGDTKKLPKIVFLNHWAESTSTEIMVYLAGVNVGKKEGTHYYFSNIENACPIVEIPPLPGCPFLVEKNSPNFLANVLKVDIRSYKIAGNFPTGMEGDATYSIEIDENSNYWYLYCVLVVLNGNIVPGEDNVTFGLYDDVQISTDTVVYFLIAEIQTGNDAENNRVVEYIYNYCTLPFVVPIPPCPFRLTNGSTNTKEQIQVAFGKVDSYVPKGMPVPPAVEPPLLIEISQKSFIYCALTYDATTFTIAGTDSIVFSAEATTKANTDLIEYVLAGIVEWDEEKGKIKTISSACAAIVPNPCALNWSTPA